MSAADPTDRDQLAGEYALGLLDGAERAEAEMLARTNAEFRAAVVRWIGRLAPLLDEVEAETPPSSAWGNIEALIARLPAAASNVVALKRKVRAWQGAAAAASALAASLAIALLVPDKAVQPPPATQAPTPPPPMVAMLGDDEQMKIVASWDPAGQRLVLAVAGGMPEDPVNAHELWVIPTDGKPRSLGTMQDKPRTHVELADALAQLMQQGATIAISVEPRGGSPTGQPTGPVIASGKLEGA